MKFAYTALTKDGKIESSVVDAVSSVEVGHILKNQGLVPTSIKEVTQTNWFVYLSKFGTVSLSEKLVFVKNLSIMIKTGIAAPKALKILSRQTKTKKFKSCLEEVSAAVESGKNLSEAMAKFPNIFSNIFVSMVRVGELSGNLDKSLEYLGIQLDREHNLRSKTKGAMIYPSVIVVTMIILGVLMSIFVLPNLTSTFKEFNADLPWLTRQIITFADFMQNHAVIAIIGMILIAAGLVVLLQTPSGKRGFHWFSLKMFVLGPIVKKVNLARICRILSSLLKSGTPIVEGLQVTSDSEANVYYKEALFRAAENVKLGKPLTETLGKYDKLFPYVVVQMLVVGEDTGTVENILEQLAEHFEEEVDDTMKNLSSIIEPLLLLIIGAVVGVLAVGLISPIYNIGNNLG